VSELDQALRSQIPQAQGCRRPHRCAARSLPRRRTSPVPRPRL